MGVLWDKQKQQLFSSIRESDLFINTPSRMSGINKSHAWEQNNLSSECYGRCTLTAATILYRAVNRLASQCCSRTCGARGNGLHQQDITIGIGSYCKMRNKLHWSESALWSCKLLSCSRNSQSFIKPLSTISCSYKPIARLCTWLHVYGLHAYIVFFLINRPNCAYIHNAISTLQVFKITHAFLTSSPVLHVPPFSPYFIL
jgi:hypothetical protein